MNACLSLFLSAVDETTEDKTSILGIDSDLATILGFFALFVAGAFALYKHKKSGPWIKVKLRPALVDANDEIVKYSMHGRWRGVGNENFGQRGPLAEVALVYVENIGGTAATVSSPALLRRRWVGIRPHHWVRSQPSSGLWDDFSNGPRYEELMLEEKTTETARSIVVPPNSHFVWAMRFMPFVREQLHNDPWPSIRLRAAVAVSGQRGFRRSPWREGWIFQRSTFSTQPWRTEVFSDELIFEALRRCRDQFPAQADLGVLAELLAESLGKDYRDASALASALEELSAYLDVDLKENPDLHARISLSFHEMQKHLKADPDAQASIQIRHTQRGAAALKDARARLHQ